MDELRLSDQDSRGRRTRSQTRKAVTATATPSSKVDETKDIAIEVSHLPIEVLPSSSLLTTNITGLPKRDITLLQKKQRLLQTPTPSALVSLSEPHLQSAL